MAAANAELSAATSAATAANGAALTAAQTADTNAYTAAADAYNTAYNNATTAYSAAINSGGIVTDLAAIAAATATFNSSYVAIGTTEQNALAAAIRN